MAWSLLGGLHIGGESCLEPLAQNITPHKSILLHLQFLMGATGVLLSACVLLIAAMGYLKGQTGCWMSMGRCKVQGNTFWFRELGFVSKPERLEIVFAFERSETGLSYRQFGKGPIGYFFSCHQVFPWPQFGWTASSSNHQLEIGGVAIGYRFPYNDLKSIYVYVPTWAASVIAGLTALFSIVHLFRRRKKMTAGFLVY